MKTGTSQINDRIFECIQFGTEGRNGREDAFLTHFRVLRGYRFFLIDTFSRPSALIG